MKNLTENEINEKLGRYPNFQQPLYPATISSIGYIKGLPYIDEIIELNHKGHVPKSFVNFEIRPYGLIIKVRVGYTFYFGLETRFLKWFIFESQQTVIQHKSKSVVGRAVLGGILLGPVGALVGGMSGLGNKEIKDKSMPENILTIGIIDENKEKMLFFAVENSVLPEVKSFLVNNFHSKMTNSIPEASTTSKDAVISGSIADEIIKLKQLLNVGVLSLSEFEAAKKKLLG